MITQEAVHSKPPKAARSGLQLPHLLHVRLGQEERECITEDLLHKLMDEAEKRIMGLQTKEAPKLCCWYTRGAGGQGLLGCQDGSQ